MFQAVLNIAACESEHCLHIGDDAKCDVGGAQRLGIQAFHVGRPRKGLDELAQKVRSGTHSGLRNPRL